MRACGAAAVPGLVSRLCASRSVSLEQGRLSCPPMRGHDDSKSRPRPAQRIGRGHAEIRHAWRLVPARSATRRMMMASCLV